MKRQNGLTLEEKTLYHQIHPLKLAADIGTTPPSLYFFWRRQIVPALLVSFVPPIIASFIVIRFVNLEAYKNSRAGHYLKRNMTPSMQALRAAGFVVMATGAWFQRAWLIPFGLAVVVLGWLRGVLFH